MRRCATTGENRDHVYSRRNDAKVSGKGGREGGREGGWNAEGNVREDWRCRASELAFPLNVSAPEVPTSIPDCSRERVVSRYTLAARDDETRAGRL
jgi:hypothetical protein